jgi:hypothetical protein
MKVTLPARQGLMASPVGPGIDRWGKVARQVEPSRVRYSLVRPGEVEPGGSG